ncbi:hypothetical protein PV326_003409 [Microctonus aethiopoides]|nr:hypothetical protein PV326_003409 [Microctonus aethiopoides]
MAQYYNIVADGGVPIVMEDGQQFCVDGQNFHLVVQDMNNGVNGNSSFITYATQDNNETQTFTRQTLVEQHTAGSINHGQSVYIINTDDIPVQTNILKSEPTLIQTKDNVTNIVRINSKGSISNESEKQQGDWINMSDNNSKSQVTFGIRNQNQRSTATLVHFDQGISEKTVGKAVKNRSRYSIPFVPMNSDTSAETMNNPVLTRNPSVNSKNNTTTFRIKGVGGMPPKPSARQPIRATQNDTGSNTLQKANFGVNRSPSSVHYSPMESLSERIKQARILDRSRPSLPAQQSYPSSGTNNSSKQRALTPQRRVVMTPSKNTSTNYHHQRLSSVSPCSTPEKMETNSSNVTPEKNANSMQQDQSSSSELDSNSESFAYLQKVIDHPANTIVQQQIVGNTVKMLVVLPTGEQRLITFDLPNEDCTVQDLLEQAQIPLNGETVVSLVSDSILNINYIVESEAGTILTMRESGDSTEREVNSAIDNSHVSDDNSNSLVAHNEEPKFIEGKFAVCPNCGISSMDFNRCSRCKKKLPNDVKQMPMNTTPQQKKEALISIDNFYKKKSEQSTKLEREITPKRGRGGRRVTKVRPMKEPECLTLSSDEEEDDGTGTTQKKSDSKNSCVGSMNIMNNMIDEPDTILDKEPIITNDPMPNMNESKSDINIKDESSNITTEIIHNFSTSLVCRTVRIGSYKYAPRERIVINQTGLLLLVPLLEDMNSFVRISVKYSDIIKVLMHFGKTMPVAFFYTNVHCAAKIREVLGMQDAKGPYYDPAGKDHTHKRITLLPDKISEETKLICKTLFSSKNLFEELDAKEANDILVRASPRDMSNPQNIIFQKQYPTPVISTPVINNGRPNEILVQKMAVYPPPPAKGGIAINTEDYACLAEDQFLNDVIIDFYLKYLTLEILSEADQKRTHVFSSYFYKRLTSRHAQTAENIPLQTPAAKRHARVQKWTKNVNIFEKDFVIIPINEHAHWFLAIICFPGLVGTVIPPPSPMKDPDVMKKMKKKKEIKLQSLTIGSTTITPVATTITIDPVDDDSERDEAEGDDEEMDLDSDDDDEDNDNNGEKSGGHGEKNLSEGPKTPPRHDKGIHKSPCILIFDSLAGASRSRVVATLRDYLTCEHVAKIGTEKTFSKDTIKGGCPKVPQQSNFTDCGLYLLQYVESFFKDPITNYVLPIKTLKNWFEEIVVTRKREELSNLLIKLMNEAKGDNVINLPVMQFPTQDGKLKPKPENPEKTDLKIQKIETENKKKSVNDDEQLDNTVQSQLDSREPISEINTRTTTTIYTIVPCSPVIKSISGETSSTDMFVDTKIKPSNTGSTLAYMKSKRIPRLISRDVEAQDSQTGAKKHKGDSYDSCK